MDARKEDARPQSGDAADSSSTPFDRFQSLTKRLLHVSKDDLREAEAREQDKRRTA